MKKVIIVSCMALVVFQGWAPDMGDSYLIPSEATDNAANLIPYTPKHNAQPAEEKFGFGDSPAPVRKFKANPDAAHLIPYTPGLPLSMGKDLSESI